MTMITDGTVKWNVADITDGIPVGDVVFRPYLKDGYLACNGQEINRSDYPRLVELADKYSLWTSNQTNEPWKFGQGDGTTTMTIPNYKDRGIQGGETAEKKEAGLPEIKGQVGARGAYALQSPTGAFGGIMDSSAGEALGSSYTTTGLGYLTFKASTSNPIYGSSTTVQPPAIVLIPQMKY